jgi:hypothetical protein
MQGFEPCRESANLSGRTNRPVARFSEQRTPMAKVAGENPARPTSLLRDRLIK